MMIPSRRFNFRLASPFAIPCFVVGLRIAPACPVIDQVSLPVDASFNSRSIRQQEVTVGISGQLTGIDLYRFLIPNQTEGTVVFDVFINLGPPWQTDANEIETTVTVSPEAGWFHVDLSAANIELQTGERFVFGIVVTLATPFFGLSGSAFPDEYDGGVLWTTIFDVVDGEVRPRNDLATPVGGGEDWDLAFRTYMEPACQQTDSDGDGDIDLKDFAVFQNCYSGSDD